jgi:hypothetical protein
VESDPTARDPVLDESSLVADAVLDPDGGWITESVIPRCLIRRVDEGESSYVYRRVRKQP